MSKSRLPPSVTHKIKAERIRKSGKKCEGCGYQFPKHIHEHQLARDQGALELDHKIPWERGGTDNPQNFQVLCIPCHDGKTNEKGRKGPIKNMTDYEWRAAGCPQDWHRKKISMEKRRNR